MWQYIVDVMIDVDVLTCEAKSLLSKMEGTVDELRHCSLRLSGHGHEKLDALLVLTRQVQDHQTLHGAQSRATFLKCLAGANELYPVFYSILLVMDDVRYLI